MTNNTAVTDITMYMNQCGANDVLMTKLADIVTAFCFAIRV